MDQDSFRTLLTSSSSGSRPRGSNSRGTPLVNASSKPKTIDASKPIFKPRKIKKATEEGKYRDRAAERREGGGNDYAHVESVLEDFQRRNADSEDQKAVEEKRKYLGGDSEHSILVKGLDMALLEQNKARAAFDTTEDDDTLEQAYMEAASSTVPKKRTRADILNDLKQKRSQPGQVDEEATSEGATKPKDDAKAFEQAAKQGKFKPIGFKPIGGSEEKAKKKKKLKSGDRTTKEGSERKKKKRKIEANEPGSKVEGKTEIPSTEVSVPAPTTSASKTNPEPEPEPEPLGDDFDIFTGAGDYDGIDLGDDDEEEDGEVEKLSKQLGDISPRPAVAAGSKGWFVTEDDEDEPPTPPKPIVQSSSSHESTSKMRSTSPGRIQRKDENDETGDGDTREFGEEEEQQLMRLQPLSSSALPSIREFLAMDEATEAVEKRRKRKEKKKVGGAGGAGGGKSMEEKVNRDYQSKKEASGTR
ncbi:hypothetical protein D9756_002331 [Leucocoprinus leucothites]|uniref:RED-like N-terminal domain-containing protein n=1 Tax=Leucocoprinus leucothites TaxID=201217 RepID=A0A8H5LM50_9AGAR|nr:hypothetical protein D9756_002331 [Leucoagaricus leucothites]